MKTRFGHFAPSGAGALIWVSGRQRNTGFRKQKRKNRAMIPLSKKRHHPNNSIHVPLFSMIVRLLRIRHF